MSRQSWQSWQSRQSWQRELAVLAQQAMRKHSMLGCKVLGVCCAWLPRRVHGTAGQRAEEGGAVRGSRGGAREGRVGGEEVRRA